MIKALYLTRKEIQYNRTIYNIIKKNFKNIEIFYSSKVGQKLPKKYLKSYDYIFSYRSYVILKKNILKKVKIAAINFHPAPPNLRGFAPASFAILKKLKNYGSTIHIMNEKIDNGKILDVKLFKINKNTNISFLLKKTYQKQLLQIDNFFKNFKFFLKNKKNFKWSKNINYKKDIDQIMYIKNFHSKDKINRIIKATKIGKFKPFRIEGGKKIYF